MKQITLKGLKPNKTKLQTKMLVQTKQQNELDLVWKSYSKINDKYEQRLILEYNVVFDKIKKECIKNANNNVKNNEFFNLNEYLEVLSITTKATKTNLINEILKKYLGDVEIDYDSSSFLKEIEKILKDTKLNLDKKTLQTIQDELVELSKKIKQDYPDDSQKEVVEKLQKAINQRFELVYKESRVRAVGRTVTTSVSEQSKLDVSKKYKLKRQWLSQRDGDVRVSHRRADGQKENKEGKFKVGSYLTNRPCGENLPAGEVVNCRCYTRAYK
jgi:hypothetical protein